jgi:hypothetical protein
MVAVNVIQGGIGVKRRRCGHAKESSMAGSELYQDA